MGPSDPILGMSEYGYVRKNADQTFAYLYVELCACGKGLGVLGELLLQNLEQRASELKLGTFGSLKAVMFASSPLSFFLFFFLAATQTQFVMRQADFESFAHPFRFEKFPDDMAMRNEAGCIEDRAAPLAASFFCKVVNLLRVCIFYIIQKHAQVKIIPTIKLSV